MTCGSRGDERYYSEDKLIEKYRNNKEGTDINGNSSKKHGDFGCRRIYG